MSHVSKVVRVPMSCVVPYYEQPRQDFDQEKLEELAESLRQNGQRSPVSVRPMPGVEYKFQLIGGERRWRALQLIGATEINVIVEEVGDDDDQFIQAVVDNSAREDLSPADAARAVARVAGMPRFKDLLPTELHKRVGTIFGRSSTWAAQMLQVAGLAPEVQQLLREEKITTGLAIELASIPTAERQAELGQRIVDANMRTSEAVNTVRNAGAVERARSSGQPEPRRFGQARPTNDAKVVSNMVDRIHQAAELALDMPVAKLSAAYQSKPAERDLVIKKIDLTMATLEQLREALLKVARKTA